MGYADRHDSRDRLIATLAAIGVQALVGWALISGLAVHFPTSVDESLKLFAAEPPPPAPPPRIEPPRRRDARQEGAASPPNLRSRATEVAAPVPVVVTPPPPPVVVAAPKPFTHNDYMSGSADVRGPGTGSGGIGDGFGSGGSGDGDGGGWRDEQPPRQIRGGMSTSDIPRQLIETGFDSAVSVRYLVAVDGRVPQCSVTRSSGDAEIDALTCRLIRERFRFRPARDERGRPVPSYIVERHEWVVEDDPDAKR